MESEQLCIGIKASVRGNRGGIGKDRKRIWRLNGGPDVLVNADGLVGAPDQTTGEERGEEEKAVVELKF